MAVIYCLNCGAKCEYTTSKPSKCSKCGSGFESAAKENSTVSSSKETASRKPKLDARALRRRQALAERRGERGAKNLAPIDEFDEEDIDESEEYFGGVDIPRPDSLGSVEAGRGGLSISNMGEFLRGINPEFNEREGGK